MWRSGRLKASIAQVYAALIAVTGLRNAAIPEPIMGQLTLFQYQQILRQIPTLYAAVISIIIGAGVAMTETFPMMFRIALPVGLVTLCLVRLKIWARRHNDAVTVEEAERRLSALLRIAILICAITSFWNLTIYFGTQLPYRGGVPIFIMIAAICATCGLASLPCAAITVLVITIIPISIAMFLSGDQVLVTMAVGLMILVVLQSRWIIGQFGQSIKAIVLQERMRILADTDSLTGLANRRAFLEAVEAEIKRTDQPHTFTIAMIDLDDFKPVNDRYGHFAGDEVLRVTATRLQSICSPFGFAARLGGDEFALLLQQPISADALISLTTEILAETAEPCVFDGRSAQVSACVGWALWPRDGETADDVIRAADRALYAAKYRGHSQTAEFASLAQKQSAHKPKRLRVA